MQRTLLALALIATAGVSYAQTPSAEPRDPYGRPLVGRNDFVRQPGDQPGPGANMATAPAARATMPQAGMPQTASPPDRVPPQSGPHQATMRDEYGFRYDSQGNRLDARGRIIAPQTR